MVGYVVVNYQRQVLSMCDDNFMLIWQADWCRAYVFSKKELAQTYMRNYGGVSIVKVTYTEEVS